MNLTRRFFATLGFLSLAIASTLPAQDRPVISQQLDGFLTPTAAVFSPDGRYLFVVNHAQGEAGTLRSQSFISKLAVDADGKVSVNNMRFIRNLTAPIDLDFSPIRFGSIPKGAIFLAVGTPLVQDEAGRPMRDLARVMVGLIVLDPNTGREIKSIDLGPNSRIRLKDELSLLSPSSICFDDEGNLYIGESGVGGHMFERKQIGRPGIWRIEAAELENLLSERAPKKAELIRTTSLPTDMTFRAKEDMLYFVTNHTQGRPSGSVFRISSGQYQGISSMQTIVRDLSALTGIQIMPKGRVLLAGNSGELMFPKGKRDTRPLRFRPRHEFSSPGKIALMELKSGNIVIAVPEQSSEESGGRGQRISIVTLPSE
ncbi:hypothetical protein IEN85_06750 [Pelagicoccus sp. NFK12]|uniref:SMP-30/Gluconolactonase/LRE-like region domain-containing protein n=1 Tax=Pelagicoccus enzymogenes TaxID=2773457 RepID=A0A927IEL9_9BACT|nr:hypothetical protein [Pelagicoccus enzymogenes]MBD5779187.1 hypothetical protein [Pelagicoccus enzymogenes]MDQ8198461.1 hypothetical protein [Pelagicoccus enzymogenes]